MKQTKDRKPRFKKRNSLKKEISLFNCLKNKSPSFNKKKGQIYLIKKIKLQILTLNCRLKIICKSFLKLKLRVWICYLKNSWSKKKIIKSNKNLIISKMMKKFKFQIGYQKILCFKKKFFFKQKKVILKINITLKKK